MNRMAVTSFMNYKDSSQKEISGDFIFFKQHIESHDFVSDYLIGLCCFDAHH